ncbi:MAG TPA: PilT/PilU family type 4a pilus ATPase [Polyangiaceae bacterium]|jgi:twitching motility protein PilT|nr:PilT/PilU family type 4a pilus ATPase [Polyangiaceae bacterium]
MKTLQQMLRELARPDVGEFAVASDRLPCIKVGGKYEPVDENARSTEEILEMLVSAGGSRYVEDLDAKPAAWTMRLDGVGSVGVQAILRDGRVQARFVLIRRASIPPAAPGKAATRKSEPPVRAPSRKSIPALRLPKASKPPPPVDRPETFPEENASEPFLRAAVVKPTGAKPPMTTTPTAPAIPARTAARAAAPARGASDAQDASHGIDPLLAAAREAGASDLHVVSGRPMLLRLNGELTPRGGAIEEASVDQVVLPLVPERLRPVLAEQGSCDFAIDRGAQGRFRVNVARQRSGLKACFRLIPPGVPTLESLGLPADIEKATHHHQGLVVVTGPTGHGKTNTLAAIVDIVNRETTHHVITVEDPVEFVHPRKKAMMSQREVGSHTQTFASALKASLREDPDVIVVGELRDTETVRMALAASETGHLVLGTMNTPSAAKTIDRLIDLFPPADQQQVRMTLAGGLHLIVSQRLVPAADGKGMVAAVELLPGSIALWSLIRDNKTFQIPSLQQRGKGFGILRLDESLYDLAKAGRITQQAALSVAEQPEELEAVFSGKRPPPGAVAAVPPPKPDATGGLLGKAGQLFGKRGG